ncbi:MAG: preprotein translocase subunit SecG [Candidatus Hydrogenedentes bacterium]|nr:preprotein translocase subunit SecG [Candidatus Hydrogenedentota bacterium]
MSAILSWATLWWMLIIIYVVTAILLVTIILMQQGKGAGFAGAFGIGPGSDAVFGPRASRSLPVRLTQILAAAFMVLALVMSIVGGRMQRAAAPELVDATSLTAEEGAEEAPAAPLGSTLGDLGIGTATTGEDAETAPPQDAAPVDVPAVVTTEEVVTEPATDETAAPVETP